MYTDEGQVVGPGYKYEVIELEQVERMELGDSQGRLRITPRPVNGAFPGMDVEPVEP